MDKILGWGEHNVRIWHHIKIAILLTFSQKDTISSGMKDFKMMKFRGWVLFHKKSKNMLVSD